MRQEVILEETRMTAMANTQWVFGGPRHKKNVPWFTAAKFRGAVEEEVDGFNYLSPTME